MYIIISLVILGASIFAMRKMKRRSGSFWLWFFGIFGALALLFPDGVLIALMSIVGIPIAVLMMAAPIVFIVLFATKYLATYFGAGIRGYVLAFAATMAALAVVPFLQNAKLEKQSRALVSGDLNALTGPLKVDVLAVQRNEAIKPRGNGYYCDEFCARVLLTKSAKQIIYSQVLAQGEAIDAGAQTVSYRLEERATCPAMKLEQRGAEIQVDQEKGADTVRQPLDLLKIAIASGQCLIEESAPLTTADALLSDYQVARGKSDAQAGFDIFADTVRADRLAVHLRDGTGFREVYRWTGVTTGKLTPILIPTVQFDGMRAMRGFARVPSRINISDKYYERLNFSNFVTKTLGLELALDRSQSNGNERQLLLDALASAAPVSDATQQLADTFMDGLVQMRLAQEKIGMPEADRELAVQLLSDTRFPVPFASWAVVTKAGPARPDYYDRLAVGLFQRLRGLETIPASKGFDWKEQVRRAAAPLQMLPRDTILKHRADLEWLARNDRVRVPAWQVLPRLHEFGADAVSDLLWLMDDAERFNDKRDNDWQHPHLAGLIGLCKMGAEGKAAVQPLFDRLDSGIIRRNSNYSNIAVNALVRMGVPPDEIWAHVKPDAPDKNKTMDDMRKQFDRDVERARKRVDCSY
jgi:hypothetical protein